jgi:uncharacterized protein YjbI with pentapeptide repeats
LSRDKKFGTERTSKSGKFRIEIFDATGDVVYRAYVDDASRGLRGAKLESFAAPLAQLQGLDMSGASLYWASLSGADLSFANLSDTDLRGASLDNTICRSTNFRNANFGRSNVGGGASLRGADLSTADLEGANLKDAVFDAATTFPPGVDPIGRGMLEAE